MADENKNQDPEEEKNQSSNDDEFGLPDFEFDALDDDDDEGEVIGPEATSDEPSPAEASKEPESTQTDEPASNEEDVPSLDAEDLEDIDLEGIEDVDLGDLEDLGDLGDLDLDDLDLGDLDKELANMDEDIAETTPEADPEGVSADRVEDIFEEPAKEEKVDEEAPPKIEDDGLFYEEESFEEFETDMDTALSDPKKSDDSTASIEEEVSVPLEEDTPAPVEDNTLASDDSLATDSEDDSLESSMLEGEDDLTDASMFEGEDDLSDASMFEGDDNLSDASMFEGDGDSSLFEDGDLPDSSMFDADLEDLELGEDDAVPFAQREVEGAEGLSDEYAPSEEFAESVSPEEASGAKSKFVRIVILGTILFVAIGFSFLYLNGNISLGGDSEEPKNVAKNDKEDPAKNTPPKEEKTEETEKVQEKTVEEKTNENKAETKPAETTPKKTQNKTTTKATPPKKTTQTKTTQTKKAATSSAGVTTLPAKTGRSYLIVASFKDVSSAKKHASKLVSKGESPTIIPPFGGAANHRVAVASFPTFNEAADNLESYRAKLGSGVWVLRY
ncbi:MAG: hypothetical protein GY816_16080 [Cytophagales bacterium]|nr:hypothetical protein [Cytophagales bacterium]